MEVSLFVKGKNEKIHNINLTGVIYVTVSKYLREHQSPLT